MNKTAILKDIDNQKFLSVDSAKVYYQLSRRTLYQVAEEANALKRIGRRVLIDKEKLNTFIDAK